MKSKDDLQRAHDMIHAVITGELPRVVLGPDAEKGMTIALDVLCWALAHDYNPTFQQNLDALAATIAQAGYQEHVAPEPMTREEYDQWRRRN